MTAAALQYVGRYPDSDAHIAPKGYADATYNAASVTTDIVNNQIVVAAANLVTPTYVDAQDALRAHKTDVTTADALYLPTTAKGVPNGVASLDASGFLPSGQLPAGVLTDRVAKCYSVASGGVLGGTASSVPGATGTVYLSGAHACNTTVPREFRIASIIVDDPGYPWRALPFAWIQGKAGGLDPGNRMQGTGNYGLLTVMPPSGVSNQVYGLGICGGSIYPDTYLVLPYAALSQTPLTVPSIPGSLQLDLYGCCWSGSNYTFYDANIVYFILVIPAL